MDKETFEASVKRLLEFKPDHPLLKDIQEGYNVLTIAYVKTALKDIPVPPKPKRRDATLTKMLKVLSKQFARRAKLSNSFHDCADDNARGAVSQEIRFVQTQIEQQMKRVDFYKKHGKKPVEKEIKGFTLPDSGYKLARMQMNLAVTISRCKKEIIRKKQEGLTTELLEKNLKKHYAKQDAIQRKIAETGLQ